MSAATFATIIGEVSSISSRIVSKVAIPHAVAENANLADKIISSAMFDQLVRPYKLEKNSAESVLQKGPAASSTFLVLDVGRILLFESRILISYLDFL